MTLTEAVHHIDNPERPYAVRMTATVQVMARSQAEAERLVADLVHGAVLRLDVDFAELLNGDEE